MASIKYAFSVVASLRSSDRTTGSLNSVAGPAPAEAAQAVALTDANQFKSYSDGSFERVRIGKMADGKWGIRVYTGAGALFFDQSTL